MKLPNLANRPRLNIRPVWVLSLCALLLALGLSTIDSRIYLNSSKNLTAQIAEKESMEAHRTELISQLQEHIKTLDSVPWKGLNSRVNLVNGILSEQQFSWVRLLDDLGEVLPWQVRLITISPSQDSGVVHLSLSAISQNRGGFLDFLDALVEDPRFDDPTPSRETWPESGQTIQYLFRLKVDYFPRGSER